MRGTEFAELASFVAIAERGSFAQAAAALGVSTSTLSQSLRGLEERLGVRLLNRTTRSVALTEPGQRLFDQVRPALEQLRTATEAVGAFRDRPTGTLRLSVGSLPASMVVVPCLGDFQVAYPEITLDVVVDDHLVDIVAGHFDAGIRPDWLIERDMIAIRISPKTRRLAVASPDYLARHLRPVVPSDLHQHNCIRYRLTTGALHRWEFEKDGERVEVIVDGSIITNNVELALGAALDGVGNSYLLENYVPPLLAAGRLVPLLEDWAMPHSGFHLYYPSHRLTPLPLKTPIEFLRSRLPRT